jgi:predicted methyltransferase
MLFLTAREASAIINARAPIELSLDLGITTAKVEPGTFDAKLLAKIAKDEQGVYFFRGGKLYKAAFSDERGNTYKLTPSKPGHAPTIEINGIRMHQVKDNTPERVAREMIRLVGIKKGNSVLDICTGLGYTAIEEAKAGGVVTTIDKDKNVLSFAKINPWSKDFWKFKKDGKIKLVIGNAFDVIKKFPDASFDAIVHDPPRFALAGELYSLEFYKQLYRVAGQARLVHYTGSPGQRFRGKDIARGCMKRLQEAGWRDVRRVEEVQGVTARKFI